MAAQISRCQPEWSNRSSNHVLVIENMAAAWRQNVHTSLVFQARFFRNTLPESFFHIFYSVLTASISRIKIRPIFIRSILFNFISNSFISFYLSLLHKKLHLICIGIDSCRTGKPIESVILKGPS